LNVIRPFHFVCHGYRGAWAVKITVFILRGQSQPFIVRYFTLKKNWGGVSKNVDIGEVTLDDARHDFGQLRFGPRCPPTALGDDGGLDPIWGISAFHFDESVSGGLEV
jgi:hypothetical protein